jgi:hypothetical protein
MVHSPDSVNPDACRCAATQVVVASDSSCHLRRSRSPLQWGLASATVVQLARGHLFGSGEKQKRSEHHGGLQLLVPPSESQVGVPVDYRVDPIASKIGAFTPNQLLTENEGGDRQGPDARGMVRAGLGAAGCRD